MLTYKIILKLFVLNFVQTIYNDKTKYLNDISNYIKKSINNKIDPCFDFYEFACGKWQKEHPLKKKNLELSTFSVTSDEITQEIMSILNNTDINDNKNLKNNISIGLIKARNHYKACINFENIENKGVTPLFQYLNQLNIPKFGDNISNWDPLSSVFNLTKYYAITPIFLDVDVTHDHFNSSKMIIKVCLFLKYLFLD